MTMIWTNMYARMDGLVAVCAYSGGKVFISSDSDPLGNQNQSEAAGAETRIRLRQKET